MGNSFRRRVRAAGVAQLVGPDSGNLNAYRCDTCDRYLITVTRAPGRIANTLPCLHPVQLDPALLPLADPHRIVNDRCTGTTRSLNYPKPWPAGVPTTPEYEWYRPQGAAEREAVKRDPRVRPVLASGGLLLRAYTGVGT